MKTTKKIGYTTVNVHNLSNRKEYMGLHVFKGTENTISFFTHNRVKKGDVLMIGKSEYRVAVISDCRTCLSEYRPLYGKGSMFYQLKITNNN